MSMDYRELLARTVEKSWNHTNTGKTYLRVVEAAKDAQTVSTVLLVEKDTVRRGYLAVWTVFPYTENDDQDWSMGRLRAWISGAPTIEFELHLDGVPFSTALAMAMAMAGQYGE